MREKKLLGLTETKTEDVVLTPWSAVHFAVGGTAAQLEIGFWWFQLFHALYETKDYILTYKTNDDSEYHNSFINSLGDHIVATIGYEIGRRHKRFHWKTSTIVLYGAMVLSNKEFG